MIDLLNLVLYCVQQLGVMLGVGAETIVLLAYLLAIRDGSVDSQEVLFARAVKKVLMTGLMLVVASGLGITLIHVLGGDWNVVFSAAFLFKWLLIALVLIFALALHGTSLPVGIAEGLAGGSWYALFAVHILAPVADWMTLLILYGVGLGGFVLFWVALIFSMRGSTKPASVGERPVPGSVRPAARPIESSRPVSSIPYNPPASASVVPATSIPAASLPTIGNASKDLRPNPAPTPPPPPPKPVTPPAAPTTPAPTVLTEKGTEEKPKVQPADGLPAVRVMPKTPQDVVRFNPL